MLIVQSLINGVVTGAVLALPTVAFSLMYATLGFPNSAFGGFVALGAYVGYLINTSLGLPFYLAAPLAGVLLVPVGVFLGQVVFRQFHGQKSLAPMIAGIGLFLVLENIVRFIWGNQIRSLDTPLQRPWTLAGASINPDQVTITIVAFALVACAFMYMKYTSVGRAIRAVSDDQVLAEVRGIDAERTIRVVWVLTSALAGAAGVLVAADSVISPLIAWQVVLPMFAGALLGGIGSPVGAVLGAMIMGVTQELSVVFLPPTYKTGVAFAVMVVVLLFRPYGLFRVKL